MLQSQTSNSNLHFFGLPSDYMLSFFYDIILMYLSTAGGSGKSTDAPPAMMFYLPSDDDSE